MVSPKKFKKISNKRKHFAHKWHLDRWYDWTIDLASRKKKYVRYMSVDKVKEIYDEISEQLEQSRRYLLEN